MVKKIQKFIIENQLLSQGERVLVALSGGADSVCLLHVLLALRDAFSLELAAVHVNHQLRGEESERDARFCAQLCKQTDITLHTYSVDVQAASVQRKQSIETAARELRYAHFEKLCLEHGYTKIAVAHNAQDNAETVLMHLLRGSGVDGLRGILPKRENIIRPLLCVDREEIEQYLLSENIEFVTDSTNAELHYGRNRIRHDLLKQIQEKYNPNIVHTLAESSYLLAQDSAYLQSVAAQASEDVLSCRAGLVYVDAQKYTSLHEAVALRVMKYAISMCIQKMQDIAFDTVLRCHGLCRANAVGSVVDLPDGKIARMEHGCMVLGAASERQLYSYPIDADAPVIVEAAHAQIRLCTTEQAEKDTKYTVFFDADKIKEPLIVRNRREGDRIVFSGLNGSKKLKSYFIDEKIPKTERDVWPLLCSGNEVLWICGMRKSALCAADETTKNVLKLTYEVAEQ